MKKWIVAGYIAIIILIVLPINVFAADIYVATPVTGTTINTAIASASVGDVVIIPDGTYTITTQILIPSTVDGTSGNPITLKAATGGGVTFTGDSASPLISVQGDWWVIQDFKFIDVSEVGDRNTYGINIPGANNVRVTNNYFEGFGTQNNLDKRSWCIWLGYPEVCDGTRVDHNTFTHNMAMEINNGVYGTNTRVDHNLFEEPTVPGIGTTGPAVIQVGSDGLWANSQDINHIFEYNIIQNYSLGGNVSGIVSKTSGATYRYNVFRGVGDTVKGISLRGGDDCVIESNYFFNTCRHSITVFGTGHKIINNYFENPEYSAILLGEGGTHYADVVDILIVNNTMINPVTRGIHIGWWPGGDVLPENLTFKKNMVVSSVGNIIRDEGHTGIFLWEGNLHYATGSATYWVNDGGVQEPTSGIFKVDPDSPEGANIASDIGSDLIYSKPISESEVGVSWLRQVGFEKPSIMKSPGNCKIIASPVKN